LQAGGKTRLFVCVGIPRLLKPVEQASSKQQAENCFLQFFFSFLWQWQSNTVTTPAVMTSEGNIFFFLP
jgi:hypothetical protein